MEALIESPLTSMTLVSRFCYMSSVRSTSDGGGPVTHKSSGKGGGNLARTPDVAVVISLKLVYTPVDDTVTAQIKHQRTKAHVVEA